MPSETRYPPIVEGRLSAIVELCRRFGVQRLDLFGSAAIGRFDPQCSDLDFLVAFEELPKGAYTTRYFDFREGLERLFDRKVDLLTEPGLKNPYLRRQIESEKRSIYRAR